MKSRPARWKNNAERCFKGPIRYHISTMILVYESIPKYSSLMEGPRGAPAGREPPKASMKASGSLTAGPWRPPGGHQEPHGEPRKGYLEALGTRAARILV